MASSSKVYLPGGPHVWVPADLLSADGADVRLALSAVDATAALDADAPKETIEATLEPPRAAARRSLPAAPGARCGGAAARARSAAGSVGGVVFFGIVPRPRGISRPPPFPPMHWLRRHGVQMGSEAKPKSEHHILRAGEALQIPELRYLGQFREQRHFLGSHDARTQCHAQGGFSVVFLT